MSKKSKTFAIKRHQHPYNSSGMDIYLITISFMPFSLQHVTIFGLCLTVTNFFQLIQ